MRYYPSCIIISVLLAVAFADNPIINHLYTADPAALVYNDTCYIFTGYDEGSTGYVMKDWYIFSSTDMVHWTDHGPRLTLSDFSWARADAWAGHCVEKNGKFYWYVPVSHKTISGFSIGVAVADHPLGPYKDARGSALITNNMTTNVDISWDDIDPGVFVDTDGQAYLYWGNTSCKMIKLKSNMIETEGSIQYINLRSFTEAPWVHKRNNTYYLSYAAEWTEYIDYAISNSPLGPWTYKGRLNDRVPSETNHQAIIEMKGRWYFIYHNAALPGGGPYKRSVCVDELFYNADGTIKKIVMTESGIEQTGDGPFKTGVKYQIISRLSNKALDVAGRSVSAGAKIQQFSADDQEESQLWFFERTGNGTYKIINEKSGLCVGTAENSVDDRANIVQSFFTGNKAQIWKPLGTGDGHYAFVNLASGKALDVLDLSMEDNADIILWPYWRSDNQQWLLREVLSAVSNKTAIISEQNRYFSVSLNSEESRVLLKQIPACSNPVLDICDLRGRSLWSSPLNIRNSETIQVKSGLDLPCGIYLVTVKSSGKIISAGKLVTH